MVYENNDKLYEQTLVFKNFSIFYQKQTLSLVFFNQEKNNLKLIIWNFYLANDLVNSFKSFNFIKELNGLLVYQPWLMDKNVFKICRINKKRWTFPVKYTKKGVNGQIGWIPPPFFSSSSWVKVSFNLNH